MFSQIKFDPKNHSYTLKSKKLISATTLVSQLEREVNWDEKALGVAIQRGVSVDTIKKEWNDKKVKAAQKGTAVHKYIERRLRHNTELDTEYPEMIAFDTFWKKASESMELIACEMVVGDYELGIGGTIDSVFKSSKTGKYHLFDWKTNGKFSLDNQWQNLKAPFDDLEQSNLTCYSLQLSIYKLIIKRNTDWDLGDSYIIWLNSDYVGELYHSFKAFDYSQRVEDWVLTK